VTRSGGPAEHSEFYLSDTNERYSALHIASCATEKTLRTQSNRHLREPSFTCIGFKASHDSRHGSRRIAINEALMLIRKRRPDHTSIERPGPVEAENRALEIADSAATPEQHCGQQQVHAFLVDAIRSLKPILRHVVQLYEMEELSTNETGEILGLRRCTVKARVFRARSELRRKLAGVWE
jgi:RNA polymerase sigma factor (sigma-70 family)